MHYLNRLIKTSANLLLIPAIASLGSISCRDLPSESPDTFQVPSEARLELPIPYRPKDQRHFPQPTMLYLAWNPVRNAESYLIELSGTPDFSALEFSVAVNKRSWATPVLPAGIHYWRVRAVDGTGRKGEWSTVSMFTIAAGSSIN